MIQHKEKFFLAIESYRLSKQLSVEEICKEGGLSHTTYHKLLNRDFELVTIGALLSFAQALEFKFVISVDGDPNEQTTIFSLDDDDVLSFENNLRRMLCKSLEYKRYQLGYNQKKMSQLTDIQPKSYSKIARGNYNFLSIKKMIDAVSLAGIQLNISLID